MLFRLRLKKACSKYPILSSIFLAAIIHLLSATMLLIQSESLGINIFQYNDLYFFCQKENNGKASILYFVLLQLILSSCSFEDHLSQLISHSAYIALKAYFLHKWIEGIGGHYALKRIAILLFLFHPYLILYSFKLSPDIFQILAVAHCFIILQTKVFESKFLILNAIFGLAIILFRFPALLFYIPLLFLLAQRNFKLNKDISMRILILISLGIFCFFSVWLLSKFYILNYVEWIKAKFLLWDYLPPADNFMHTILAKVLGFFGGRESFIGLEYWIFIDGFNFVTTRHSYVSMLVGINLILVFVALTIGVRREDYLLMLPYLCVVFLGVPHQRYFLPVLIGIMFIIFRDQSSFVSRRAIK